MIPKPASPYASSKLAGEDLCAVFQRAYGLESSPCASSTSTDPARTRAAPTRRSSRASSTPSVPASPRSCMVTASRRETSSTSPTSSGDPPRGDRAARRRRPLQRRLRHLGHPQPPGRHPIRPARRHGLRSLRARAPRRHPPLGGRYLGHPLRVRIRADDLSRRWTGPDAGRILTALKPGRFTERPVGATRHG